MDTLNLASLLQRIENEDTTILAEIIPFITRDNSSINPVFDALELAAEKGNSDFAEFLGYEYSFKFGGPRKGDAIKYLEIAANAHRPWAGFILADIYQKKAQKYLRQAAEDGSPSAAKKYLKGLADAHPDPEAAFELATDIVRGLNDKAFLESTHWSNLISSTRKLSDDSAEGIIKDGIPNDAFKKEALKYARIAADAGVPGAETLVESLTD